MVEVPEEIREEIKSILLEIKSKLFEDFVGNSAMKISSTFKVCSFTVRIDSMLMWSHYANYHKGFCLEYDLENIPYGDFRSRCLYPVIYSDTLMDATEHIIHGNDDKRFVNELYLSKAALVKASDWKYEKEWRLVFSHGILQDQQSCNMGKPKAMYLGTRIHPIHRELLIHFCKEKEIPVFKMKVHPYEYKLEPTTIEDADNSFSKEQGGGAALDTREK